MKSTAYKPKSNLCRIIRWIAVFRAVSRKPKQNLPNSIDSDAAFQSYLIVVIIIRFVAWKIRCLNRASTWGVKRRRELQLSLTLVLVWSGFGLIIQTWMENYFRQSNYSNRTAFYNANVNHLSLIYKFQYVLLENYACMFGISKTL
jgi:hypothetical protein